MLASFDEHLSMSMKKRESQRDTSPCCELLKVIEESTGWAHASGPNNSQQGGFRTWTHQTPSEGAVHSMVENGEERMSKNAGGIINQQRENVDKRPRQRQEQGLRSDGSLKLNKKPERRGEKGPSPRPRPIKSEAQAGTLNEPTVG